MSAIVDGKRSECTRSDRVDDTLDPVACDGARALAARSSRSYDATLRALLTGLRQPRNVHLAPAQIAAPARAEDRTHLSVRASPINIDDTASFPRRVNVKL